MKNDKNNEQYDVNFIKSLFSHDDQNIFMYRNTVNGCINFDRNSSSYCELCQKCHDKDNTLYVTVSNNKVYKHCRKFQGKSILLGDYKPNFALAELPSEVTGDEFDKLFEECDSITKHYQSTLQNIVKESIVE